MSETINAELVDAARYSPTLSYMIKKGLPLTREKWIAMNWGRRAAPAVDG